MLEKAVLARVLEAAIQKGGDWAEVYVESKEVSSLFCEDNHIERTNRGREKGVGIRVLKDDRTAYVYTNHTDEDSLLAAARVAGQAAGSMAAINRSVALGGAYKTSELTCLRNPNSVAFEEKVEQVMAANRAARQVGEEIRQVTVSIADIEKKVQIANSSGDYIEDKICRVRASVNTVAHREGRIQTGFQSLGGTCGWEILDEDSFENAAARAARLAISMLGADPAPSGPMPVVMAAEAGGTMVHEACGHGLEADLVQKGLSVYNKREEIVAATEVSVIDDPTLEAKYGSFRFDDEGNPAKRSVLINQGVLKDYLYDRITAARDGRNESCNGRRESYQHKPIPRMSNTFIAPGQDDPDEIIKSTAYGLLVKKMGGGQVNTSNGDFVFEVQEGYMIKDGEVTCPVRGATLTGNGPLVLQSIDRVGRDLGFGIGVCGKDGQGVPVADAQPTIRIKELTVGGTGNGTKGGKSFRRL